MFPATDSDQLPPLLRPDSIPTIDLRLLSQSDLYYLSTSSSNPNPNLCDDVTIPKIDRTVFNESAGSRKQTYSRLRLAPPAATSSSKSSVIHRRTRQHLRSVNVPVTVSEGNNSEQAESSQIICVLKELFRLDPDSVDAETNDVESDKNVLVTVRETVNLVTNEAENDRNAVNSETNDVENDTEPELVIDAEPLTEVFVNSETKRKRGRPRRNENAVLRATPVTKRAKTSSVMKAVEYDSDKDREIVNSNGVKVDIKNLSMLEDPYGPEIRRRSEGFSTADELLGFLRGLNGQWGTTRKKRRVVDASDFGDYLPKGWKLSLAVRKKDGLVWVFCRRYISPSDRQFESCNDISMYLISLLGEENLDGASPTQSNAIVPVPVPMTRLVTESLNSEMIDVENDSNAVMTVLVPVTVPVAESLNSEMVNVENDSNVVVPVTEPLSSEMKRSRGRPRKRENMVYIPSPAAKRMRVSTVAKAVKYDSYMDHEILNCNGVKVNIVNLSRLEDPYGPEIRKRAEGLSTEDELLGFLRGLNGQWGTARKKRRFVDASDFGDTLPKGWKLNLCVKKKGGRVWVSCHCYISPGGRHFESCKDVSMYLLSLHGEESLDKPSPTQSNVVVPMTASVPVTESLNSEMIDAENNSNVVVPLLVMEHFSSEMKRTRGRPRKHENAGLVRSPPVKVMCDTTATKVVVYDSDMDRETVNCKGVEVDIVNLSRLEDPFGPEIRRRTEGISTADELLGFLRGLNGQWGTTRKKRRVVDSSDFGDALPKGWKLSLSVKKKGGLVWVFCRRYISPSGRQFESCKDISMYLLSLLGKENMDKPSLTHDNDSDDPALIVASGNAADLYVQEDLKRDSPVHTPSVLPLLPTDCEKQVPVHVHAGEHYKCLKCFLIFEGKIDLFDHQALVHEDERSQLGFGTSEWSIVIGRYFECWFCHKTFYEMNQYNGHIGTHATNEDKTSEAAKALTAEKTDDSTPISSENNVIRADKLISASPQNDDKICFDTESKTDELVHDLNISGNVLGEESGDGIGNNCNINDDKVPGTDKAPDVSVSKSDTYFGYQASISITESNGKFESSGRTVDCVNKKSDGIHKELGGVDDVVEKDIAGLRNGQDAAFRSSGNSPLLPFKYGPIGSAGGFCKNVVGKSAAVKELSHAVSETRVQTSSISEETGFRGNINDMHNHSSFGKLTSAREKHVNIESSSGVFYGRCGLEKDRLTEAERLPAKQNISLFSPSSDIFKPVNNASISSIKQEAPQKLGFASVNQVTQAPQKLSFASVNQVTQASQKVGFASCNQVTHGFDQNRFSYGAGSSKPDGQIEVRSSAFDSYNMSAADGVTSYKKEDNFKSRSSVSPWHENKPVNKGSFHIENSVNNASSNKLREANLDDYQFFRNNQSINSQPVIDFNTRKNLEFSSLVPPENEQAFSFQDDVTGLYESGQENSERGLHDHFSVAETSDEIFGNKIYSTSLDGINFDEDRGIGIHDLNLAFGNPHDLYADTASVSQKKDGDNCSAVPSKIDVQTNLSMVNNSIVEEPKMGRESVSGSFSLSHNSKKRAFQHDGNTGNPGSAWEDLRQDEFRSREDKKLMVGSGSSNQRQGNEVVPPVMWKSSQGSQVQSGLVNPHAQSQSPSSFHSFDIMSNKAEDGLYRRHGERYNDGPSVNVHRSGRPEPVEYRFLTGTSEHNPHALQGGSRAFPYNTGMEQQAFDSNFWMGKNTMMSNMGGRNVVTSVCAWCRNEVQLPAMAIHQQAQAGVGSLCPNCNAGFSGQANML